MGRGMKAIPDIRNDICEYWKYKYIIHALAIFITLENISYNIVDLGDFLFVLFWDLTQCPQT